MRKLITGGLTALLAAFASPALAQEAEALRRELEQMRRNFETMQLGYKLTERSQDVGFSTDQASARHVDELLFQATFILGAHPAHPF